MRGSMPNNKGLESLKAELNTVEQRLRELEHQKVAEQTDSLKKSHEDLAAKVNELKGSVGNVGLVFSGVSLVLALVAFVGIFDVLKYRNVEDARANAHAVLTVLFEDKLASTIDRVSFVDRKDDRHEYKIEQLIEMRDQLRSLGVTGDKFEARSELAWAVKLVADDKPDEALGKLEQVRKKTESTDRFVNARAYTMQAMIRVRKNYPKCDPSLKDMAERAIKKDNEVAAAFNILGLCSTVEAENHLSLKEGAVPTDDAVRKGTRAMRDAQNYNELSFTLNPTAWAKSRYLNNRVWESAKFILAALGNDDLIGKYLSGIGYGNIEEYFKDSFDQLDFCELISPRQTTWWETRAELYGLQNAYYEGKYEVELARDALENQRGQVLLMIGKRHFSDRYTDEALRSFQENPFLRKLRGDPEILRLIKESAKMLPHNP
jgi:hypothetical protein